METNKKALLIGIFAFVMVVLFILSIGVLGSGVLFSNKVNFIMYFDESVKGLRKGGKVAFKGVSVGEVLEVNIVFDSSSFEAINQVIVQIDKDRLKTEDDTLFNFGFNMKKMTRTLIKKGLKAQLQMESIVTGVLMINLDFDTNVPIKLREKNDNILNIVEIPTKPSGLTQITQTLDKIPVDEMLSKFSNILNNIEKLTETNSLSEVLKNLDDTIKSLKQASDNASKVLKKVDSEILPIMQNASKMVDNANKTFEDLREVAENLNDITKDDSKLKYQLEKTLEATERAAKSIETLTDYLARHPNSVLYGK
ncbi:MAG: MlaD family protein [Bdellovibrionota bacterium]